MYFFIFIYNVILIAAFSVLFAAYFYLAVKRKEKLYRYVSFMFFAFFIDIVLLFMTEYLSLISMDGKIVLFTPYEIFLLDRIAISSAYILITLQFYNHKITKANLAGMGGIILLLLVGWIQPFINKDIFPIVMVPSVTYAWILIVGFRGIQQQLRAGSNANRISLYLQIALWIVFFVSLVNIPFSLAKGSLLNSRSYLAEAKGIMLTGIAVLHLLFLNRAKKTVSQQERLLQLGREYNLSNRELELLPLLFGGKSYQQISKEKFISVSTVKVHKHRIFTKLGIHSDDDLRKILEAHKRT